MENFEVGSIVDGFNEDLNDLINGFVLTGSIRFKDFAKVWRNMRFSQIFRGRESMSELVEFCEEVLNLALHFSIQESDFQRQVGAFYAMYALYFKQPIMRITKIRVTQSNWENLIKLIDQCGSSNHIDVVFIHNKLLCEDAYCFVLSTRTKGLESAFRRNNTESKKNETNAHDVLIDPEQLELYKQKESLYIKERQDALGSSELKFVNSSFLNKVQRILDSHASKTSSRNSAAVEPDSEDSSPARPIGERRESLRMRTFGANPPSTSDSTKHKPKKAKKKEDDEEEDDKGNILNMPVLIRPEDF